MTPIAAIIGGLLLVIVVLIMSCTVMAALWVVQDLRWED